MSNKRRRQSHDIAAVAPTIKRREEKKSPVNWIEALAKKASSADQLVSKEERIGRRLAKKQRRDERKSVPQALPKSCNEPKEKRNIVRKNLDKEAVSQERLKILADRFRAFQEQRSKVRLQQSSLKSKKKGSKAKQILKTKWNESGIQPRHNDYGGIGLARPSLFLPLNDPSFIPKVEQEFAEHIPGFFGKQRTKAMKKQLNGQMLWRKLAEKRIDNPKVNGKKLAGMSPDERVEALLKAGVI